ncbi:MAG: hypothetical protein RLZZ330_1062 [Actinomycetota bacterium]|jgi:(p)ppGpp synthase/HD superfamily hydrolase
MTKEKSPKLKLSSKFAEAFEYANGWHLDKSRKSTEIAYICHPLGVASLAIEGGGDENAAIAALLHDVAEDHGGEDRLTEILEKFGPDVERIVRACSDSLTEDPDVKDDWKARKEAHLAHLREINNVDTLIVTAADKTHNARAIVTDLQIEGAEVWKRFTVDDPTEIIWYYESMYEILEAKNVTPKLLHPLRTAIDQMIQGSR